jgi:hypothetical protein
MSLPNLMPVNPGLSAGVQAAEYLENRTAVTV